LRGELQAYANPRQPAELAVIGVVQYLDEENQRSGGYGGFGDA
jgi:hypothetical protein